MSDELPVGDKTYVSSKRASEVSGYAQDYIGQLARSGQIESKRMGGLWYVLMESLETYKTRSAEVKAELPKEIKQDEKESDVLVSFDGKDYISANRASKITGYNQDYVGQLARAGKILSRQVGNRWFVDRDGILAHKQEKDAMLAAVQADSVGIQRRTPAPVLEEIIRQEPEEESLLMYNVEYDDLSPRIEEKAFEDEKAPASETPSTESAESTPVAITVKRPVPLPYQSSYRKPEPRTALKPAPKGRISLAAGLSVLTIVIVLSFGFVGLNAASKFASLGTAKPITMSANALSGFVSGPLDGIMEAFEDLVSPPLNYQRSD